MPKELEIGTTVTRKGTGQIGKIMGVYYGNYIIELSAGDGYKHETVVVTPAVMEDEYSTRRAEAGLHLTAAEQEVYESVKAQWENALTNLMTESVASRSPIPLSPGAMEAMKDFARQAAEDIAVQRSGEVFTNAVRKLAEGDAHTRFSPEEAANERAYRDLMADVKGTPAEAKITEAYQRQKKALEMRKQKYLASKSRIRPSAYADPEYMEHIAQAIWVAKDVYPRMRQKIESAAQAVGMDPASALEQPTPVNESDIKPQEKEAEAMQRGQANYEEQVGRLKQVAVRMKEMLKDSEDIKAMARVLPPQVFARMISNVNLASTPAEILASIAHYTASALYTPRTGTQTRRKKHEAKGPAFEPGSHKFENQFAYKLDADYPEYASVSSIPEERQMLAYRGKFVAAIAEKDFDRAKQILADMREVKDTYKAEYNDILSAVGPEITSNERTQQAAREFEKSMEKLNKLNAQWGQEAEKEMPVTRASSAAGYAAGQPVRYKDNPAVHFIVSYDDNNPLQLYLIPEKDVNSHDRTELIVASIDDVSPVKVYQIDIGDLVDAFGTVGRVTDASGKDLGYVYAELKNTGQIVPVDLSKTATPWQYAEPIKLCKCANDGGLITPGQEHNCPFIGQPMMAPKAKEDVVPPVEAKAPEIDLKAALESLDVENTFPPEAPAAQLYEDEQSLIEIGSTVKKFGSLLTGTVVGFSRNCCVVDWESGISEPCWRQELVIVTRQEDAA